MPETFAALLFAHCLADFILQTDRMVAHKRQPAVMAAHIAIVLITVIVVTGSLHPALLVLTAAHLALDAAKAWSPRKGLGTFLADQAGHLISLVVVALWVPNLWSGGLWMTALTDDGWLSTFWANPAPVPALLTIASGLILATRAGGFAVGLYMAPWAKSSPKGLPGGGRAIGLLERGLIFLLVLTGQAEGIGFLIAAKSVLRFGAVGDDRAVSEYVIIGTLASFGWAIAVAFGTVTLLHFLTPLGIPDLTP